MLAQVLHQVYGGGILAVIMHHRKGPMWWKRPAWWKGPAQQGKIQEFKGGGGGGSNHLLRNNLYCN